MITVSKFETFNKKNIETVLKGHTYNINALVNTNDSKFAISGGDDNTIRIWNLED